MGRAKPWIPVVAKIRGLCSRAAWVVAGTSKRDIASRQESRIREGNIEGVVDGNIFDET
jgi:hypothetical protein